VAAGDNDSLKIKCLRPGDENTVMMAKCRDSEDLCLVAVQCCVRGSTDLKGCRRYVGVESTQETCVAGIPPQLKPFTYVTAVARCEELGETVGEELGLCDRSCASTGCFYNKMAVLTDKACG